MKVAIVHEWLDTYAGSERVVEALLEVWPEADLFAVCDFLPEGERAFLKGRVPRCSPGPAPPPRCATIWRHWPDEGRNLP